MAFVRARDRSDRRRRRRESSRRTPRAQHHRQLRDLGGRALYPRALQRTDRHLPHPFVRRCSGRRWDGGPSAPQVRPRRSHGDRPRSRSRHAPVGQVAAHVRRGVRGQRAGCAARQDMDRAHRRDTAPPRCDRTRVPAPLRLSQARTSGCTAGLHARAGFDLFPLPGAGETGNLDCAGARTRGARARLSALELAPARGDPKGNPAATGERPCDAQLRGRRRHQNRCRRTDPLHEPGCRAPERRRAGGRARARFPGRCSSRPVPWT